MPQNSTMCLITGGQFSKGTDDFYPEESPAVMVFVDSFWIDIHPVTNQQFREFVTQTGYKTTAERPLNPQDYPGMPEEYCVAGSLVFTPPTVPVYVDNPAQWWAFTPGACWHTPLGLGSTINGLDNHPVVHISYEDALAYANWAGKVLPTEAQWEYAAKGGRNSTFPWGEELAPDNKLMANYWHGAFPHHNSSPDGFVRTSPVGTYPANDYGLLDMIGNVWEWTQDYFSLPTPNRSCCVPKNPTVDHLEDSFDPATPDFKMGRKVIKGGSHLCAVNYCQRYRAAARVPQQVDSSTSHIGFRCVKPIS